MVSHHAPLNFINTDHGNRLEERRKAKAGAYYERKKLVARQRSESKKTANVDKKTAETLQAYGY